jgi:zinc finger HIT domain-containing protein 1
LVVFAARVKTAESKRVLDDVSRRRRQRKALEALESDNFSEDPHADLKMSKKAPKFEEAIELANSKLYLRDVFLSCYWPPSKR